MEICVEDGGPSREDISDDDSISSPSWEKLRDPDMDVSPCSPLEPTTSKSPPSGSAPLPAPSLPIVPRLKAYPPESMGPFVVFFRPKIKRLNTNQINKDLTKRFSSIIDIDLVGHNKIRVTLGDRKQANEIVSHELFTREYHVYLPSHEVEISGVVTEGSMTCEEIMQGSGFFKNRSLPPVKILDCKQMQTTSQEGEKKVRSLSNSFCVTFSGSALPMHLVIGKLRLPVRLYVPRVMHCDNCKQLGHTTQYCCNKPRCASCGERHGEGACKTAPKCVYCNENPPHALAVCPKYIQRQEHQKRSLQQRSRRSYAEMLKKTASSTHPNNNIFASLPLDDQGPDSEVGVGSLFALRESRKRAIQKAPNDDSQKVPRKDPQTALADLRRGGNIKNTSPPGLNFQSRNFPPLPGSSKTPEVPVLAISTET